MVFFQRDELLTQKAEEILESTWQKFPTLAKNQIALTWIPYQKPIIVNTGGALSPAEFWQYPLKGYSYRGQENIYPASIVKIFYLVAIWEWLETKMVTDSPELQRAITDMITESSNDATSLIIDTLTGTTSGPELSPEPMVTWSYQRNIINRYYQSLGWEELNTINVNQKTWCDGPYGRERVFVGENYTNRNMLTTNALARLLHSIVGGVAVSSSASQKMMNLLRRDPSTKILGHNEEENQVSGFTGAGLLNNYRLWSKAGWTSTVRHDSAYIERDGQTPYLLIVFTEGKENSQNREILPFISAQFAQI